MRLKSIKNIKLIVMHLGLVLLFISSLLSGYSQKSPYNSVYQYATQVGSRTAYLWIPPDCKYVRGVILSLSNLLERNWLEDPLIRKTAGEEGLGIIWVGPAAKGSPIILSADMKPGEEIALQKILTHLADESGYKEIEFASLIPMGHSANGHFAWTVPNWNAERVIAAIPVKTIPLPDSFHFKDVPLCYVVGQTTEWPQYRVPDPATKPGDRDFFWPVVRKSAVKLRSADKNNLVAVVTEPGGGHFDWSEKQARFIALYIRKACQYRLPEKAPANGPVPLKMITPESGWLTDIAGMEPDRYKPAPYKKYKGHPKKAYWFFDEETAKAAVAFNGDRKKREKQMLTFVQNGMPLPVAKSGFASLKFLPESDGVTFKTEGAFLSEIPKELIGAGTKLGHAPGAITFSVIDGPAIQTGPNTFRIQFNRGYIGGAVWIDEENSGNKQYRKAVQPGQIMIPSKLTNGKEQTIIFPEIPDQNAGIQQLELKAMSGSGLPIDYYMVVGPAIVEGNLLKFTKIPVRSKYPVKVRVVAYQWGRTILPLYQSAEMVTREFYITSNNK